MYTIDASVWINSFDAREPGHEFSRRLLEFLRADNTLIIVPNLAFVEIGGAIRRRYNNQEQAELFANTVMDEPNILAVLFDNQLILESLILATQQALRGADAIYAAVAVRHRCTLVSLDIECLTRLASVVETRTPEQLLAELLPPDEP